MAMCKRAPLAGEKAKERDTGAFRSQGLARDTRFSSVTEPVSRGDVVNRPQAGFREGIRHSALYPAAVASPNPPCQGAKFLRARRFPRARASSYVSESPSFPCRVCRRNRGAGDRDGRMRQRLEVFDGHPGELCASGGRPTCAHRRRGETSEEAPY
jgi:hypothetical protein